MVDGQNPIRTSTSDVVRRRVFLRDVAPAVTFLVAAQGSLVLLDPDGGASARNLVWSLLPLLPACWLCWALLRNLRRADEFQRVLQLQAMAIGFGACVLLSLASGLLDAAGIGTASQGLQITFIGGVLAWLGAQGFLSWRAG